MENITFDVFRCDECGAAGLISSDGQYSIFAFGGFDGFNDAWKDCPHHCAEYEAASVDIVCGWDAAEEKAERYIAALLYDEKKAQREALEDLEEFFKAKMKE